MMKLRNPLLLLLVLTAVIFGPGAAMAADEPTTTTTVPTTSSDTSTDTAPITLDQDQIDALTDQANQADDDKSVFEKASDFVTDNAPWFIIGIIVLAAIIAGILIMRGRPRKSKGNGTPKAKKSTRAMRKAGGLSASQDPSQPAQVPSPSELRRRKRAAIQRSREEERMRRKAGIEGRKAARRGEAPPVAPVAAAAAGAGAVAAAGVAASGGLDPVEAEKQSARDQETAAAAMARFDTQAPAVETPAVPAPTAQTQAVPAPVSPSQTAPAAGVVTPDTSFQPAADVPEPAVDYAAPVAEPVSEYVEEPGYAPEAAYEPEAQYQPAPEDTIFEPAAAEPVAGQPSPEAETSILHEPSLENPGPDAAVGKAAEAFLAGGAAGAAGGLAAARARQDSEPDQPAEPVESLEPVVAPEPAMTAEHALADTGPVASPVEEDAAAAAAEERLRAKVAEIKATQEPVPAPAEPAAAEPQTPPVPDSDLSPGLAAVERRLSENSEERDRALRDAEDRLRRVEQRAEDAERRAAFAERLAQLKVEESEREKRLNDVVSGIDRAEQRAKEAEARAEAAERAAAAALEKSDVNPPATETPAPQAQSASPAFAPATPPAPPAREEAPEAVQPESSPAAEAPAVPERKGLFSPSATTAGANASDVVNLNTATFEELREVGLSVTQATRILAYRERFGGYSSVEDLEKVPGFPADLIESLKGKISV